MAQRKKASKPASPSRKLFGERLRAERKARGLTQEGLGELADLSWNYVGQVERGVRNVSIDNMDVLARAVGRNLYELLMPKPEPGE